MQNNLVTIVIFSLAIFVAQLQLMSIENQYQDHFKKYREQKISDRYITNTHIEPLLKKIQPSFKIEVLGESVNGLPIYNIVAGTGNKKILMWSQMHGNESTTTKAIFDMLNTLVSEEFKSILDECTFSIIPILNPDGAKAYTRFNANNVDLNRDAQDLTQPESKILQNVFKEFQPDFCLNLHGQRTIFSVDKTPKPATVSFLAPAQDDACTITENRKRAMELISVMNEALQNIIPEQVGIYDDAFNINCVGDAFQSRNTPTVLFEAGHIHQDYQREQVREYIYTSLMTLINYVSQNEVSGANYKPYLNIPENGKQFYDIIIRNAKINVADTKSTDIAIQFEEVLLNKVINFIPKVSQIGNLNTFYGHREIDAKNSLVSVKSKSSVFIGDVIDFATIGTREFSLKLIINE